MLDSLAALSVVGIASNAREGDVMRSCTESGGCDPNFGESHICSSSDTAPFRRQNCHLAARALSASEDAAQVAGS